MEGERTRQKQIITLRIQLSTSGNFSYSKAYGINFSGNILKSHPLPIIFYYFVL